MSGCSYIERRGSRYYFRMRLPLDIAAISGRTHVVSTLSTSDARVAKINSARLFLLLAAFLETMRLRMAQTLDSNGKDYGRLEMLAAGAFALGQEFNARTDDLKREFAERLNLLIASFKDNAISVAEMASAWQSADPAASLVTTCAGLGGHPAQAYAMPQQSVVRAQASPAWTSLKQDFLNDKPGLTAKTLWSYSQAFDGWAVIIGDKPIGEIKRADVKAYADFLRDKENPRGGKLDHKTIQRSLGHIKTFMLWAVAAGHAIDDNFCAVTGRDMTKEEQFAGDRRRALTPAELERLFKSPFLTKPANDAEAAAGWFLAIAALTGARTAEIAMAPAKLALIGGIYCLDLREAGRKTSAAPRMVPLLPDLIEMGVVEWAKKQEAKAFALVQPGAEPRTPAAWSKLLNRHLNARVSDDPEVVLYSLRHSFRQMLRAGNIGDELADKIFGHSTGKVGAGYGRDLSPAEAQLFIANVKPPLSLERFW